MTYRDAYEIVDLYIAGEYESSDEKRVERIEAFQKVKEACEIADKHRWHDLRKNPDDLPPNGTFCMTILVIRDTEDIKFNRRYGFDYGDEYFNQKMEWEVIAWLEIEPFEEKQL